ncbi:MAG: GAF domain-containing protein, partial [Burkholderiales bacterium]|nr:GAF domain-containing protein [Anaerolineae bacterium]
MALKTNGHTWTKSGFTGDFDQMLTGLRDALGFLETRVGNLTNDLQVASEISQQITTVLELGQLLPQIVEKTNASFNLYHSQVYLLDESGENLILAASAGEVGRTLLAKGHKIPLAREDSLVARCGRTRVGIIVNDVKQEAGYFANPLLPNTRAEMTVPMVVGGELIGVLDMQSEHVDNFSEDDLWVKTTLAGQIAVAVQNARTFAEAQRNAEETNILYEMTSKLAQATTRAEILDSVSAYPKIHDASAVLLMYTENDDDGTPLWAEAAANLQLKGESATAVGERYYLPHLPFTKLWISNPDKPLLIGDVMTSDLVDANTKSIYELTQVHGSAIIPLTVSGRWVGLIVISWHESQTFTELDHRIYGAISQQTASVVNSTRLFEQTQKSARELETVAKVSAAATSVLDMDTMLQSVSDLTRESFELYHAHVYLLDEARENLVLTAGAGEIGRTMKAQGHSIPLNREHSLVARAARTAQGVIVNDITQEPDFLPNELLPNTKAEMAVPMIVGGEVLGVLDVQSEQAGRFGTNDANVQTTLASQIAVAVQNARSYAVQQKTAERLDRIYTMSIDLIGSANFNGYFVELNPAWEAILGHSVEELKAAPFVSFVHPDDVDLTNNEAAKLGQGALTISFVNRYRCKDGSYKWILWHAVPCLEQQVLFATGQDI